MLKFEEIFNIKLKILVNLDLSVMQFIYYSDDFEINAENHYLNSH